MFKQTPPQNSFSTINVFRPALPAISAAKYPPGPEPTTIKSNSSATSPSYLRPSSFQAEHSLASEQVLFGHDELHDDWLAQLEAQDDFDASQLDAQPVAHDFVHFDSAVILKFS